MSSNFKINKAGVRKLEKEISRQVEKATGGGLKVPAEGSEEDAVRNVKAQIKKMGAEADDAEVRRIVRQARQN